MTFSPGDRVVTTTGRKGIVRTIDPNGMPNHALVEFPSEGRKLWILFECLNRKA